METRLQILGAASQAVKLLFAAVVFIAVDAG
jgi:hypothetical protein